MKIEAIGNLGHDAETKQTQDNRQFLKFTIAENTKQNGQEQTQWIDCLYNNIKAAEYLKKGCKVFVRGTLKPSIYTKKDGTSQIQLQVSVSELEIVQFGQPQSKIQVPANTTNQDATTAEGEKSDLPF